MNIFELASVAVPVHVPGHWYAIGIDMQRRIIAVIDSLRPLSGSPERYRDVLDAIHRYAPPEQSLVAPLLS